jgi:urea transport system substrate-binding protein
MQTTIKAILKSICLLLLALSICCICSTKSTSKNSAEPIKIGALLPFSGGVELFGTEEKLGFELAAKEITATGGILGRPIEIIYEDDKTRPASAVEAVHKLIDRDGVLAVVGPITSSNLNAIAPTMEQSKTPLLYATNYEGGKCSRYIFCLSSVPNQELGQLLSYMNETFGNTYYLFGADRDWPHAMFQAAEPMISALGGRVVGTDYTKGLEADFGPAIKRITDSKAKVLLFALKGDGLLNCITQMHDLELQKKTNVAFLGLSETDLEGLKGKCDNMFVVVPFVASSDIPAVKEFVAKVKAQAGKDAIVSNYVMTHYNTLIAVKAALEKAGKVDKEAMIDALEGLVIQSPTGPVTIGKNHHATMNMFLAKAAGTDLVTVRALGEIAPQPGCK